jgi:maltooligosyltrehalose trehalohydrolase
MLEWYRELIDLRRHSASLNDGDMGHVKVRFDEARRWLTLDRGLVRVMCNLGPETVELENPAHLPLLLASKGNIEANADKVRLPPDSLAILSGENIS